MAVINVTKAELPPTEEFARYLKQIWSTGWLTNHGPLSLKLEAALNAYLGVKNLIFVSNGTVALEIAIKALQIEKEIITTPFSYVATTSSIAWIRCKPVMVDIDPESLNIDAGKIEAAITPDTQAILATHTFGNPCEVEKIEAIARRHNLKVIYDAAHCFGVKYQGQSVLNWGDCSTLSFHATKIFHTCEGGAVLARSPEIFQRARYMMNFGHGHGAPERFLGIGINAKNSELHSAVGLCMLPRVAEAIEKRRALTRFYDESLRIDEGALQRPKMRPGTDYNFSYYPVVFPSEKALKNAMADLAEQQIFPRRYFYPSLSTLNYVPRCRVPVSEDISARILCLPLYPSLAMSDVSRICGIVLASLMSAPMQRKRAVNG